MGGNLSTGFLAIATFLATAALGVAVLGLTVLGLGLMFSWFDRGVMSHIKDGLLRITGGAAIVGGANAVAAFIVANFKL